MTDTTDTPNSQPSTTAAPGTGGGLIIPSNDNPPPVTIMEHVLGAFIGSSDALTTFFGADPEDHEVLEGFKSTLAAMRNMPPEALKEVTIPIIDGFFTYFKQDPHSSSGRQSMAVFDSNIALAIQDAAQHIMQNMNAQAKARAEVQNSLMQGRGGRA